MKKGKAAATLFAAVSAFVLLTVFVMTVFCLTACGEADVTSISLDASGAVTEYEVGDEFSADGLKVTAEMSDGTRKSVDIGDCDISRPDMSVDGAVTVTVTYEGKTASYEIVISERTERFDLMSFNIRTYGDSGNRSWETRRDDVVDFIMDQDADIVCLQEVTQRQYNDIKPGLSDKYGIVWYHRGDNEGLAILYDNELGLVSEDMFWLSETPEEQSYGWGANFYRICVNTLLKTKDGAYINVYNVHLDHQVEAARVNGLALILERAEEARYPAVLMGDFNADETRECYDMISSEMQDCRKSAEVVSDAELTWNNWGDDPGGEDTYIDFIFADDSAKVDSYEVCDEMTPDGRYISDHFAIKSAIRMPFPDKPEPSEPSFVLPGRIEAEDYSVVYGEARRQEGTGANGGDALAFIGSGDVVAYENVFFDKTPVEFVLYCGSDEPDMPVVTLRLDSADGPVLAEVQTAASGDWFEYIPVTTPVTYDGELTGYHDLYLCLEDGINIDAIELLCENTFGIYADTPVVLDGGTASVTVRRSCGDMDDTASVVVKTVAGTASEEYFAPLSQTLTFEAGEIEKTVTIVTKEGVRTTDDDLYFDVAISDASDNAVTGGVSTARITLRSVRNALPGKVQAVDCSEMTGSMIKQTTYGYPNIGAISDGCYALYDDLFIGTIPSVVKVCYSGSEDSEIVFRLGGADGAVIASYVMPSAGSYSNYTECEFDVTYSGEPLCGTYDIYVELNAGYNFAYFEFLPEDYVEIGPAAQTVNEGDTAEVTLTRTGSGEGEVSVTVTAVAGTAPEGDCFEPLSQKVTFGAGETEKTVSVPTKASEHTHDGDVYFDVTISDPENGATIGDASSSRITLHFEALPGRINAVDYDECTPGMEDQVSDGISNIGAILKENSYTLYRGVSFGITPSKVRICFAGDESKSPLVTFRIKPSGSDEEFADIAAGTLSPTGDYDVYDTAEFEVSYDGTLNGEYDIYVEFNPGMNFAWFEFIA